MATQPTPRPLRVFCSYSYKDQKLHDELLAHLVPLQRQGLIDVCHDRMIAPGTEWRYEIDDHLASADIILLLVSADYLASDYCYGREMALALQRHDTGEVRVIPIILRLTQWHDAPFAQLQALPTDAKPVTARGWYSRDDAWSDVINGIRKVIQESRSRSNSETTTQQLPTFGELLGRYRRSTGLTQQQLAQKVGISQNLISNLELNLIRRPHADTLLRLVDALNLTSSERATLLATIQQLDKSSLVRERGRHSSLPLSMSKFIGREREVATLTDLLLDHKTRLITLTGSPGIGKTRIAVEVAASVIDVFPDGVFFVTLAAINDPSLVATTLARALQPPEVRELSGQRLIERLIEYLRGKRLLLILDTFEHVAEATPIVIDLLTACPELKVLVTSRAILGVTGEHVLTVTPVAFPAAVAHIQYTPEALERFPAVALFVERAQQVKADFTISPDNAAEIAEICQRLNGLPLAIELAAAWVRVLSPRALLAKLEDQIEFLRDGTGAALPRHRTLRAALDWSYDLLHEPERVLLRRLAIFANGWMSDAAQTVCAGDGLGEREIPDVLAGLTQASLVQATVIEGGARFYLLELIRQYGLEKLDAAGETAVVQEHYLDWCIALVEGVEPGLVGPERQRYLTVLDQEYDNLRAALKWAYENGNVDVGLRIAAALQQFWMATNRIDEGLTCLDKLLALELSADTGLGVVRAKAIDAAANLVQYQGDYQRAETLFVRSLALRRELGDKGGTARVLTKLAHVALEQGDYQRARPLVEESILLHREMGNMAGIAISLDDLGLIARAHGDYAQATVLFEESLNLRRKIGMVHFRRLMC